MHKIAPTIPELMFLERRRKGLNQTEYGELYRVSQHRVSDWETSMYSIPLEIITSLQLTIKPTDSELLTLMRRRKGEKIRDAASKIGITPQYLTDVERKGRGGRAKQHLKKYSEGS